jgi:hypothetical protein
LHRGRLLAQGALAAWLPLGIWRHGVGPLASRTPSRDLHHTPDLPTLKPHFDPPRVCCGARQDVLDHAFCQSAGLLIRLENDKNCHARLYAGTYRPGFFQGRRIRLRHVQTRVRSSPALHAVPCHQSLTHAAWNQVWSAEGVAARRSLRHGGSSSSTSPSQTPERPAHHRNSSRDPWRCGLHRCSFHRCTNGSRPVSADPRGPVV